MRDYLKMLFGSLFIISVALILKFIFGLRLNDALLYSTIGSVSNIITDNIIKDKND